VIAMMTQRIFLISYLTESMTDGSLGKALLFLPYILDLLFKSFTSPTIPVFSSDAKFLRISLTPFALSRSLTAFSYSALHINDNSSCEILNKWDTVS
jgi:hypothetical protein